MLNLFKYLVLFAVSVIVYFPSYSGDFVFDDLPAVLNNPDVVRSDSKLMDLFIHDFWGDNITRPTSHKSYRPLTTLTFRTEAQYFGIKTPSAFHRTNLFLHGLASILAYKIYRRLLPTDFAFLASLMFAVHPVHTESVAGIVGRADLLYSVSLLTAFLLASGGSVLSTAGLCFMATLCKEQGIMTIPIVLANQAIWDHKISLKNFQFRMKRKLHFAFKLLLYSSIVAGILYFRFSVMNFEPPAFQPGDNPSAFIKTRSYRLLNFNYIYALNSWLTIAPDWLSFDWALGCIPLITTFSDPRVLTIIAFWSITLGLVYRSLGPTLHSRIITTFLLFIVLPFLPASNVFFPVGFVIAERNLYLSVLGVAGIVVLGMRKLLRKRRLFFSIVASTIILSYCAKSFVRSSAWRSEDELFISALSVCPDNAKVHYNIAKRSADRNDIEVAVQEYRKAIELFPEYEQALNNLGNLYKQERRYTEAKELLMRALKANPKFSTSWMNLGIVLTFLGEFDAAERSYIRGIDLRKTYPDCHYNLGNLYLKTRSFDKALAAFAMAIEENPAHFSAWSNLIILLDDLERFSEAETQARTAIALHPDRPEFAFHLANVLGKTNRFEEAEAMYLQAVSIKEVPLYHVNLGVLYHRWKRLDKAVEAYRKALLADPDNESAKRNLDSIVKTKSRKE